MNYASFSLNGDWGMAYSKEAYHEEKCPEVEFFNIEDAVPGYWEDMKDKFALAPFCRDIKTNEIGMQHYPIAYYSPDMVLPNIWGNFYYKKTFSCEDITKPTELHFEGVQNTVSVWFNGVYVACHKGYSESFDIKIPEKLIVNGENTIVLSVSNYLLEGYDGEPVSGITSRAACNGTGGITGDVELRVYESPMRDVATLVSDDLKTVTAIIDCTEDIDYIWEVYDGEKLLKKGSGTERRFTFETDGLLLWSPENPKLYTLKLTVGTAVFERSFGVRMLLADGINLKFNGIPYFLRGICEHCYFPDTVHPHHNISYYRELIKKIKSLGFNFIRFHTQIPADEYMQAADELGILVQVESANNTTIEEWKEIVRFCRRHPSVVIYCCGNELFLDEPFIEHLEKCGEIVHEETDALFSPMSALRGVEYYWAKHEHDEHTLHEPFDYQPLRLEMIRKFSDVYNSFAQDKLSYFYLDGTKEEIDSWKYLYDKPRISHEICIDGTYTDLSLKDRYRGSRIADTAMLSSIESHLASKGLLERAPLFFKNSSEWQRRVRKYCFELARSCETMAGYDFLGPIDTHWHTFGYNVGMMNEFYELKPGETTRNVLMYNSETVILSNILRNTNLLSGEEHNFEISVSYFGKEKLDLARLNLYIKDENNVVMRESVSVCDVECGKISKLFDWNIKLPIVEKPKAYKLYATLDGGELFAENEWEIYVFPKAEEIKEGEYGDTIISSGMSQQELTKYLEDGKDVILFGTEPFASLPTSFRIALAGRTEGNLATVINDNAIFRDIPHEGFCGWQFNKLLEKGSAVCFVNDDVVFDPIVEVASTHKFAVRQAAVFEFNALNGRLFVCGFNFEERDAGAKWLKARILDYVKSDEFEPEHYLDEKMLKVLIEGEVAKVGRNSNLAFNPNDITAVRKNKKK